MPLRHGFVTARKPTLFRKNVGSTLTINAKVVLPNVPVVSVVAGSLHLERNDLLADDEFRASRYGSANLVWDYNDRLSTGIEVLRGRNRDQQGETGYATRVQASLTYVFLK